MKPCRELCLRATRHRFDAICKPDVHLGGPKQVLPTEQWTAPRIWSIANCWLGSVGRRLEIGPLTVAVSLAEFTINGCQWCLYWRQQKQSITARCPRRWQGGLVWLHFGLVLWASLPPHSGSVSAGAMWHARLATESIATNVALTLN